MTCRACDDVGLVPFVPHNNPKTDAEIGADDLHFAICLCPAGAWFRSDENAGRSTGVFGWQVHAARYGIDPSRMHRVEDVFSAEDLASAGLSKQPTSVSREAALLAAGKSRRPKL